MAKKKKKESDFQKTKLKVGRKLLRGTNDTKTDFKSKKIIVKEMESRFKDPIKTLSNGFGLNCQTKVFCLNNVEKWLNSTNINSKSGEVVSTVSKYLNDSDQRVRSESIRCLKHCVYLLHKNDAKGVSPLMPIILTYVNCGLTHINPQISSDCLKLLSHLIEFCDESEFNQLMKTTNILITNKSRIDSNVLEICNKLVSLINKNNSQTKREAPVVVWSSNDGYCDVYSIANKERPSHEINFSFQTSSSVDVKEKFLKLLEDVVRIELKALFSKDTNLSISEARKGISALKIISVMGWTFDIKGIANELNFNITAINTNEKTNRKQKQIINNLYNELNSSLNKFLNESETK